MNNTYPTKIKFSRTAEETAGPLGADDQQLEKEAEEAFRAGQVQRKVQGHHRHVVRQGSCPDHHC